MSERKESDFLKRMEQLLKRTGGKDSNCKITLEFHLNVLLYSNTEDEIEFNFGNCMPYQKMRDERTRMELCRYLLSKLFFDKMELYPTQPFKCQMDEYSDWPLSPLPSELFGNKKQEDKDKTMWFYLSLKVGDILDCRVFNIMEQSAPSDQYSLKVIHKYGVTHLLDDLELMVFLCSEKNEMKILEVPLLPCEFVRAAVCQIVGNKDVVESVYVTVDVTKFEESSNFRSMPKLGRIIADDIPSYVFETSDTEKFSTYSDYLLSKPQFHNPHFYDGLLERCGVDPRTVCSYFPEYNRKPCNEGKTGQILLKESKSENAKILANSALKSLSRKQYDDGLKLLKNAMDLCPENAMMSKLYEIKSNIYVEQMKTSQTMKSLCDLEMAFRLAPEDDSVKQKLLHEIFKAANCCYRLKQYKEAVLGFEFILKHDETHRFAARALDRIKAKHADELLNFEEMNRFDLQEKKTELLTELKKIKTL